MSDLSIENVGISFTRSGRTNEVLRDVSVKIDKGSGEPHVNKVGTISMDQVRQIAERKMPDLNANDVDAASKIIAGTARSMGVDVTGA